MAAVLKSTIRSHYDVEDAMEHLYDVTISDTKIIFTTVTKHADAVTQWITEVRRDDPDKLNDFYVGFDVEYYTDAETNTRRLGAVTFCIGHRCLIIHPLNSQCPWALADKFLDEEKYIFVGFDVVSKMKRFKEQYPFEGYVPCMDLNENAAVRYGRPELKDVNRKVLTLMTLGVEVEIPPVSADDDWGRESKLSDDQVHRACVVAFINLEIGRWLTNFNLHRRGRPRVSITTVSN